MKPGKNVLVVDDDAEVRESLKILLESMNYRSDAARDAYDALRFVECNRYDVVVTDYHMPGMDGLELITILREKSPSSALILMSGELKESFLAASGAHACLRKPFTAIVLNEAIDKAVTESRRNAYNNPSSMKLR